jgi:hypothetical protein
MMGLDQATSINSSRKPSTCISTNVAACPISVPFIVPSQKAPSVVEIRDHSVLASRKTGHVVAADISITKYPAF